MFFLFFLELHLLDLCVDMAKPERIYTPITAMGFSAMFIFQLDNTKR